MIRLDRDMDALISVQASSDIAEKPPGALLTATQVGHILNVRPKRVYELGIPCVRISERSLRWRRDDLEAWISQRRGTT